MGPILRHIRRGNHTRGPHPFLAPTHRGGSIQPAAFSSPVQPAPFYVTDISIPAFIDYNGTVFYQIHIFAVTNYEWLISHRYSEFYVLYEKISYWLATPTRAPFPKKKSLSWMVSTNDEELRERTLGLNAWLKEIVSICTGLIQPPGLALGDLARIREYMNEFLEVTSRLTQIFSTTPVDPVATDAWYLQSVPPVGVSSTPASAPPAPALAPVVYVEARIINDETNSSPLGSSTLPHHFH